MSNVTPLRPGASPPGDLNAEALSGTRERIDDLTLTGHLLCQTIKAAIALIEDSESHKVAADVLRLARDRWEDISTRE